jgi:hypothetical protein
MQEELDRRPPFRRLAHDALYYISREWEKDEDLLELDDGAREKFEAYLIGRMALEAKETPAQPAGFAGKAAFTVTGFAAATGADAPRDLPIVSREDLRFLWKSVHALAQDLASPAIIRTQYEERGLDGSVLDAVREAVELGPILIPEPSRPPGVYRWRFRRSGREALTLQPAGPTAGAGAPSISPPPTAEQEPVPEAASLPAAHPEWKALASSIRSFESTLKQATSGTIDPSTLSAVLGLLPTSPAWPSVNAALSRLDALSAAKTDYPELEEDVSVVHAFHRLLRRDARTVTMALSYGFILKSWSKAPSPLLDAVEKMCMVLGLRDRRPEHVRKHIDRIGAELQTQMPPFTMPTTSDQNLSSWISQLGSLGQDVKPVDEGRATAFLSDSIKAGWDYWYERLRGGPIEADLRTIVCAIAGAGAFALLRLPVEVMTLRDWSLAFHAALLRRPLPGVGTPPPWLAIAALRQLGWGSGAHSLLHANQFSEVGRQERVAMEKFPATETGTPMFSACIAGYVGGISDTWRPTPRFAALLLSPGDWADLHRAWSSDTQLHAALGDDLWTVVDVSVERPAAARGGRAVRAKGDRHPIDEEFLRFLAGFGTRPPGRPVPAIVAEKPMEDLPAPFLPVVRPASLEALFSRVSHATIA